MKISGTVILLAAIFFISCMGCGENDYLSVESPVMEPVIEGTWPYHLTPESAGWSSSLLDSAKVCFDSLGSAAVIVVYCDRVLLAWGDYSGEYLTHSARKSFMSAMYGIGCDDGMIDLQQTMAELGIDDVPPLSDQEKQARVIHLLQARSGVYHTAATETERMHDYKPDRDTYLPGAYWCYNNWDFNTLVTIFNQETGRDFFESLIGRIAVELEMEEFDLDDTEYYYQHERSMHPAYHFQISARDAARFGLLYLQKGVWKGKRLLSEAWINESTAPVSDSDVYIPGTRYGYMWWIFPVGYAAGEDYEKVGRHEMYAALGAFGQVILVIPDLQVVYVHRVDSYSGHNVSLSDWIGLLDRILSAGPRHAID
jgi:CubicO group peptidase (beta-lactamase class C family)